MQEYAVMGVHDKDVLDVNEYKNVYDAEGKMLLDDEGKPVKELVKERNVVRVRMFVGDQMIDEDFVLPRLITIEEQIDAAVTTRIDEIKTLGTTDPTLSKVVEEQPEQIVEKIV